MNCSGCGQDRYTHAGLCEWCAPMTHARLKRFDVWMTIMERRFTRATGKTALDDWGTFEAFLVQEAYRWWTSGWWRDERGWTLKVGPVSITRYRWMRGEWCIDVCVWNRWCWPSPASRLAAEKP